jgi:hypothetical protein
MASDKCPVNGRLQQPAFESLRGIPVTATLGPQNPDFSADPLAVSTTATRMRVTLVRRTLRRLTADGRYNQSGQTCNEKQDR